MGWTVALGLPLGLAWWLRRQQAWINLGAVLWVVMLAATTPSSAHGLATYGLGALGAIGLIAWGLHEARPGLIHLGLAGFALTVLCFYFSTVMDKLGRAASLAGLGVLFSWVAGCWKRPADACWPGSKRVRHEALDQRSGGRRRAGRPGCLSGR